MASDPEHDKLRLDKWLWAARFFKTRALAKEAIEGGKVHCRGERCKPGKEPRVGDEYQIRQGFDERRVIVRELSAVRRGAAQAQLLYEETAGSLAKREAVRRRVAHELRRGRGALAAEVPVVGPPRRRGGCACCVWPITAR